MPYNPIGLFLIIATSLAPLLWLPAVYASAPFVPMVSHFLGMAALIVMGWIQFLATRNRLIEPLFDPLDQVYRLHKWLGIIAFALMMLHDNFEAEIKGLGPETWLTNLGESLGEQGLNGFIALTLLSVLMLIPYRWWYLTHRFIGAFFAASAVHFLLIRKPFENADPLGLYVSAFCLLGLLAYAYQLTPRATRMRSAYTVTTRETTAQAVSLTLSPEGRGLRHKAGQFAFFSFDIKGKRETHPFTIASAPTETGTLRVTAAPLGDFTRAVLPSIPAGTQLRVEGPFGHFTRKRATKSAAPKDIWIAGGIGVTPFVAWAEAMKNTDRSAVLVYAVPSRDKAAHLDLLEARAAALPNLELKVWESATRGRLNAHALEEALRATSSTPIEWAKTNAYFCGPIAMGDALHQELTSLGLKRSKFFREAFEMRSGIGIEAGLKWLISRFNLSRFLPERLIKML